MPAGPCQVAAISIVNARPPARMNSGRLLEYGNRTFGKGESLLAFVPHESASLEPYSGRPGWATLPPASSQVTSARRGAAAGAEPAATTTDVRRVARMPA